MFDFRKLQKLLEKEISYQEKLLELLTRERVAIVKLNQDQLDEIRVAKEQILNEVIDIEGRRKEIFDSLAQSAKREEPLKFTDVLELCPPAEGRGQLKHTGDNLRKVATEVRDMNTYNSTLIKQSLGLIVSTIAIMRSNPDADLPTYTQTGSLSKPQEDPAFAVKRSLSREA